MKARNMAKEIEYLLGDLLLEKHKTIAVAESCTGGLVSGLVTNVPGCSKYFLGGIVAYSNQSKLELLKISETVIQSNGPVSRACANEMAQNVRKILRADIGVGITGIAGPGGGTDANPVGSVYVAVSDGSKTVCKLFKIEGDRGEIREKSGLSALKMAKDFVGEM